MTKETIKYYIDNMDAILDRIEDIPEEELTEEMITNNIEEVYNIFSKYNSDTVDKYNLNLNAFKMLVAVYLEDKIAREQLLGREESNKLLRDIIDIYGDDAYKILGCNSPSFEMSNIDGILAGENNQKYEEFYTKLLNWKCERAISLKNLSDILLSTKPEYISAELIEVFLKTPDKKVFEFEIQDFINTAPNSIISGLSLKLLVNRVEKIISHASILEQIPPELFDENFSRSLLEKAESFAFAEVFGLIPEQAKDRDIWEFAISKNSGIVYSLPEQKIDENMTDDEYSQWCEKLVIDVIKNHPANIQDIFSQLRDSQKTSIICSEAAKLLQAEGYDVEKFLEKIPKDSRTRELYEILLEKSEYIIRDIPDEPFEEGLSQEEYNTWVDNIITQKIAQRQNTDDLYYRIPSEKRTERVWNALLDKCIETGGERRDFSLFTIPIQNITVDMCERALRDIGFTEIGYIPSIDRDISKIGNQKTKEEYEKWFAEFSEEEKAEYREWHENTVIEFMQKMEALGLGFNIFSEYSVHIPMESITTNIIKTYLDLVGPTGIAHIPVPNELTKYNKQYEDMVIYAIRKIADKDYAKPFDTFDDYDILDKIPEEYRTDKVILEAIKKHPKYLDYADFGNENFSELLQIGYKNKLESIGRTELSEQEIELMKKFAKNNSSLFSTLNLDIFTPEIIDSIGENSLEKIVRYKSVQNYIIELSKDKDALTVFSFALENLKQDNLFIEPLIEQLSRSINSIREISISVYNSEQRKFERKPIEFLKLASNRIQDESRPLTEEEKTIISYLTLNPQEARKIKSYDDVLNFVANKNAELDEVINSKDSTLIDVKNAYLQRIIGMNYASVVDLVKKYGNDPEELLAQYEGRELGSYKEKSEKEALEIVIKLKSLIEEKDLSKIQEAYFEAVEREDKTKSFERYNQATMLDNTLRRAYGRDITKTLSDHSKENNIENVQYTKDGQEYLIRKLNGPFNRMISVMNAYRKSDAEVEGDMYDRWNTSAMAGNHALCYSFIDESNPGTAMLGDKKGIIISIEGFDAEAVTAAAPYDLCSDSRTNTTVTDRQQKFYTAKNLPNQTRGRYSEVDIEIQDVSEGTREYRKIQPTSIICFEEIDEDSIKAAIELSKKLGRIIPVELIDRRELAKQTRQEIDTLLDEFKNGESLQPELVRQIITKFNNVRNAHMDSNLADEIVGEKSGKENPNAMFNKAHLNGILIECIGIAKQRMEKGDLQQGLKTIAQIKQFIREEREKNELMPTMHEKQIMSGIDLEVDYSLDEIQRMYGTKEISTDTRNTTLEILQGNQELNSTTFEIMYGKRTNIPEQLTWDELRNNIDISGVQRAVKEVHENGYYSQNKSYSEEHVTRVILFSETIARLEGADAETIKLLMETAKYYSSGRQLDIPESHEEYSAKIAGRELSGRYSQTDICIIQAAIELQNFNSKESKTVDAEQERKDKLVELCNKYGISGEQTSKVDCIATYIKDAVELDKTRFVKRANNPYYGSYNNPEENFCENSLKTDTAKKLIKVSYELQDELSTKRLGFMTRIGTIPFDREKIMKAFFTEILFSGQERHIVDSEITNSPIVREAYLKHRFQEVDFESLVEELAKQQSIAEQNKNLQVQEPLNVPSTSVAPNVLPSEPPQKPPENIPPMPPPPSGPPPMPPENLPPIPPPPNGLHNIGLAVVLPIANDYKGAAKTIAESRIARNVVKTSKEVTTGYHEIEKPIEKNEVAQEI